MFEPGQRVRCVAAKWFAMDGAPSSHPPTFGGVYTVVAARSFSFASGKFGTMLAFAEMPQVGDLTLEYDADGFRPLEDAEFERLREACLRPPAPISVRELAGVLV